MFCTKCGKELPEGAKFCPKCGNKIGSAPSSYIQEKIEKTTDKVAKEINSTVESVSKEVNSTVETVNKKANETKEKVKVDFNNFNEDVKNFKFQDLLEKKYVDLGSIASSFAPLIMVVLVYVVLDILGLVIGLLRYVPLIGNVFGFLFDFIYYVPLVLFVVISIYSLVILIYRAVSYSEIETINIFQIITCVISLFSLLGYFIWQISWSRWIGLILIIFGLDFFVKAIINGEEISGTLDFGQDIAYIKEKIADIKAQKQAEKEAQAASDAEIEKEIIKADKDGESSFDGDGISLFGYQLLTGLLSLVTCGLAAPYGIIKITKWRVSHTIINGKRLTFNGTTMQLWGLYIKWFFLTLITCGIYSYFAYVDYKKWEARHTSYEGSPELRGIYPGSQFTGNSFEYLGYSILTSVVTCVTCGIAYPWMACLLNKWELTHTNINKQRLSFDLTGGSAFGTYFLTGLLTIITCGIYAPWGTCKINRMIYSHTHIDPTYVEQ